jgi:hypothetical protein
MSRYLTIRSDEAYSKSVDTGELTRLLVSMSGLRQTGPAAFEAAHGMPWTSVILAVAAPDGNYATSDTPPPSINVIELIGSDNEDTSWHEALACHIAAALNWQAIEERENRLLWPTGEPHA